LPRAAHHAVGFASCAQSGPYGANELAALGRFHHSQRCDAITCGDYRQRARDSGKPETLWLQYFYFIDGSADVRLFPMNGPATL
jgi:hypothetical protein